MIDTRISFYSRNTHLLPPKPSSSFRHLKRGIQDFFREGCGSVLECLTCGHWARHIHPSLVLVQPRKTRPCLNERLLMGRKESNKTNKQNKVSRTFIRTMFWFQLIKLLTMLLLFNDCIIVILLSVSLLTLMPINCRWAWLSYSPKFRCQS